MLRSAASVAAIALVTAGGASAEVVARGVQDGLLALDAKGTPSVAWVHNSTLFVATRTGPGQWTRTATASVPAGSSAVAFEIGAAGPVAARPERRRPHGRARAPALGRLGDDPRRQGRRALPRRLAGSRARPAAASRRSRTRAGTRPTLKSRLLVSRVDAKGRISTRRITQEGFPKSLVPPPSAPVLFGDVAHVVESYGYRGVVGHDRVVPVEEGLDRARAGRRDRRLPDRPGLCRPQPERDHARRLDRVDAHVRHRGGAGDPRRPAPLRELGVRARPRR